MSNCEKTQVEDKPSQEELEAHKKEQEEKEKEKEQELLKRKEEAEKKHEELLKEKEELERQAEELKASDASQGRNELSQNEIVEGMQSMNLRRQSEENDQNVQNDQQPSQAEPQNQPNEGNGADAVMEPAEPENQPQNPAENNEVSEPQQQEVSPNPLKFQENKEEDMQIDPVNDQPPVEEEKKNEDQPAEPEPQSQPEQNENSEAANPPPVQEPPSNLDPRITVMLQTFGITVEQVRNQGIDVEVLGFLPEEEVASILSTIPPAPAPQPEQQPSEEVQPPAEANPPQEDNKEEVEIPASDPVPDPAAEPVAESNAAQPAQSEPPANSAQAPPLPADQVRIAPARAGEGASEPTQNDAQPVEASVEPNQVNSQPPPQAPMSNDQLLQDFLNGLNPPNTANIAGNVGPSPPSNAAAQNLENDITRVLEQSLRNAGPPPSNLFAGMSGMGGMGGMNFNLDQMFQMNPPAPNMGGMNQMPAPPPPPPQVPANQPPAPVQVPGNVAPPNPAGAPPVSGANEEEKKEENKAENAVPDLPEGIDPEFFNSLPEEFKQDLLRDTNLLARNLGQPPAEPEPPQGQPDAMDTASFLASLTDQNLRREILITMDEQTMQTLPEHVQAEGRRYQRELQRRHQRREHNPERMFRRMLGRAGGDDEHHRDRDRRQRQRQKKESFMDLLCRKESKVPQENSESSDIRTNTIKFVFSDDRNLKNLLRIIMIASQKRNHIEFKELAAPIENLCKNPIIRSKINQCFMLILRYYKDYLMYFGQCMVRRAEINFDSVFPPVFIPNQETRYLEEIHHPKIALFIFKLFNYLTARNSSDKEEIRKAFYSREKKENYNQIQGWFTSFEKGGFETQFINDSPFLSLLKYIVSADFFSNQIDMSEMLKIASNLIKNYIKPIKEKKVELDDETLSMLFKLITLKIDKEMVNQICSLFHSIALIKPECIFENFKKSFIETIPAVKEQLFTEVQGKYILQTKSKFLIEVVQVQSQDSNNEESKGMN